MTITASTATLIANLQCHFKHLGLHSNAAQHIKVQLEWITLPNNHIICFEHPDYPERLRHIDNPPSLLFVSGNPSLLNTPQIAIVGSRKATHTGLKTAYDFAASLAKSGLTITSGMAYGIDAAAHKGALAVMGNTISVWGTGLDIIYPRQHEPLAQLIAQHGAIVSEYPLCTPARKQHFPHRNRLVTGMSLGALVVQASLKSGTLISARTAMEQNREVFAIPGSIYQPQSEGCHALIKQGAKCVTSVQDILDELPLLPSSYAVTPTQANSRNTLDASHQNLLECIDFEPTAVDEILRRSQGQLDQISPLLLQLELQGHIYSVFGGYARVSA